MELVKKILERILKKKKRDEIFLASKCGISKFTEKKILNKLFNSTIR